MKKGYLILLTAFILTILLASFATTFDYKECSIGDTTINNTFSNQYFTIETDDCKYDSNGDTILVNVTQHIATFNSTLGVDLALWFPTFASMNYVPYYDGSSFPLTTFSWGANTSKLFNVTYGDVYINQASSFKFNISVNLTSFLGNYSILLDPMMNQSDEEGFEVLVSEPDNSSPVNVSLNYTNITVESLDDVNITNVTNFTNVKTIIKSNE